MFIKTYLFSFLLSDFAKKEKEKVFNELCHSCSALLISHSCPALLISHSGCLWLGLAISAAITADCERLRSLLVCCSSVSVFRKQRVLVLL